MSDMMHRPWSLDGKRLQTASTGLDIPTKDAGIAWRSGTDFTQQCIFWWTITRLASSRLKWHNSAAEENLASNRRIVDWPL